MLMATVGIGLQRPIERTGDGFRHVFQAHPFPGGTRNQPDGAPPPYLLLPICMESILLPLLITTC
jgi:hypothetical protein